MNVLIVYAHFEPSSFTAAIKNISAELLTRQGHKVVVSDLYGLGFNPTAQKWDFVTTSGGHFNYMLDQKHAATLDMSFSPDILGEIQKLQNAELVIFISPMWWLSAPAILKGWFDRVLAMGVAWDSGKIFESGLMRGKQAIMMMTAAAPSNFFTEDGRYRGTPEQLLHPITHGTLAFCGFDVHEPLVFPEVESTGDEGRAQHLQQLRHRLDNLITSPQWLSHF